MLAIRAGRTPASAFVELRRGRLGRGQGQADAVRRDALRADRPRHLQPLPDLPREVRGAGRDHLLGDALQPDHLAAGPAGEPGEIVGRADLLGREPGVDQELLDAGRRDHPAVDLRGAQRRTTGEVLLGRRQRLQVEQRRAVPPDRQPQHRVEERRAERRRPCRLVHQRLEAGAVEVLDDQAVAVVVDQRAKVDGHLGSLSAALFFVQITTGSLGAPCPGGARWTSPHAKNAPDGPRPCCPASRSVVWWRSRPASWTTPGSRGPRRCPSTGCRRSRRGAWGSPPRSTTSASTTGSRRRRLVRDRWATSGSCPTSNASWCSPHSRAGPGRRASASRRVATPTTRTAGCCWAGWSTGTPNGGSRSGARSRSSGWSPPVTATRSPPPSAARPTGCPGSARPPTTRGTCSPHSPAQGVAVEQYHPEYAPGQFELSVAAESPVHAADTSVLVRQTIRSVGQRHGFRTSYSPKVDTAGVGNGGHVHLSLWREGRNLMAGGTVDVRAHRRGGGVHRRGARSPPGAARDRCPRRGVVPPARAAALGRRLPLLGPGEPGGRSADGHRLDRQRGLGGEPRGEVRRPAGQPVPPARRAAGRGRRRHRPAKPHCPTRSRSTPRRWATRRLPPAGSTRCPAASASRSPRSAATVPSGPRSEHRSSRRSSRSASRRSSCSRAPRPSRLPRPPAGRTERAKLACALSVGADMLSRVTAAPTKPPLTAFWHDLPREGKLLLSVVVFEFIGTGLVLPFWVVYLHEVRSFSLSTTGLAARHPAAGRAARGRARWRDHRPHRRAPGARRGAALRDRRRSGDGVRRDGAGGRAGDGAVRARVRGLVAGVADA